MQINADNSNDKFVFCLVCSYRLLSLVAFVFAVVVAVVVAKGNRPLRLHRQSTETAETEETDDLRRQPGP